MSFTYDFTWLCHVIPPCLVGPHLLTPPGRGTGFGLIGKVVKFLGYLGKMDEQLRMAKHWMMVVYVRMYIYIYIHMYIIYN